MRRSGLDAVLLINPPPCSPIGLLCTNIVQLPPMGLAYLAAAVRQHGFDPTILDMRSPENDKARFVEEFRRLKPKVVGFSIMTDFVNNSIRLARIIKSIDPECWVVFGGPHPGYRAAESLNTGVVDVVAIKGDGEAVFVEICKKAATNDEKSLCEVQGIVFKDGDEIVQTPRPPVTKDLDQIHWPAWDLLPLEDYSVALIHTSRGCVGSCKFCCEGVGVENRPRKRSIDHVREELRYVYDLGIRNISFSDDNFVSGKTRLAEICEMVKENFPGLSWSCETRSDTTDLECVRMMADAGCRSMHYGVESIFPETHKQQKKKVRLEDLNEKVALAHELGVMNFLTFVMGLPNETGEQIRQSFAYAMEMEQKYKASPAFGVLTPYPGSDYGEHPEKYGITIESTNYDLYNTLTPVISTPHLSQRELQTLQCDLVTQSLKYTTRGKQDRHGLFDRGLLDEHGRITVLQAGGAALPNFSDKISLRRSSAVPSSVPSV